MVPHMAFRPCSESRPLASPHTAVPRVRGAHEHFPPSKPCPRPVPWPLAVSTLLVTASVASGVCVTDFPAWRWDLGVEVCEGAGCLGGSG